MSGEDVRRADEIAGPIVAKLRGSTVQKPGPTVVVEPIPRSETSVCWGEADLFFVDKLVFLMCVFLPFDYTMAVWVKNKTAAEMAKGLKTMAARCVAYGHQLRAIRCDMEQSIHAYRDEIALEGVVLECEAGVPCPHVERKGRTVKEFVRGQRNGGLPWVMPWAVLVMAFLFIATRVNLVATSACTDGRRAP